MRIKRLMVVVVLAACALLVGAACGGEQGDEGAGAPETREEATTAATTTAFEETTASPEATESTTARAETAAEAPETGEAREVVVVTIAGLQYEPAFVEVAPGTTVRWVSEDQADHTVTSEEASGPLASDVFNAGGSFEYTFEEPGQFAYFCEIHPFMKGTVAVG